MPQIADFSRQSAVPLQRTGRAHRQARVGIIPNPVEITLPIVAPREVWSRWPKLRSSRRPGRVQATADLPQEATDPILSGERLREFAKDLRGGGAQQSLVAVEVSAPPEQQFTPPLVHARPLLRLALAVFLIAAALIVSAILFG